MVSVGGKSGEPTGNLGISGNPGNLQNAVHYTKNKSFIDKTSSSLSAKLAAQADILRGPLGSLDGDDRHASSAIKCGGVQGASATRDERGPRFKGFMRRTGPSAAGTQVVRHLGIPQPRKGPQVLRTAQGVRTTAPPTGHRPMIGVPRSKACLLYTSPSPRDATLSRMPSSA